MSSSYCPTFVRTCMNNGNNDGLLIAQGWKMYRGYNNPVDRYNLRNRFFYAYNCNNSFKMHFISEYRCDDLDLQTSALGTISAEVTVHIQDMFK
jgi:hypothetical protein